MTCLALLDQNDVWDERYLEDHLAIWSHASESDLGLSYGPSLYWFPEDAAKDHVQELRNGTPRVFGWASSWIRSWRERGGSPSDSYGG